jgi:hypothetical protein
MYFPAADAVGFAAGGTEIVRITSTGLQVTDIKAKDGTAALSIADSTGVVSVSANPVLSGGTANGVVYLNASKVATSGTALTFNGTDVFGVSGSGTIYTSVTNTLAGGSARLKLFNAGDTSDGFAIINNEGASGQVNVLNYKNSPLAFWTNSTEKMRLLSGGQLNLGGNFTSTNNTLQVTGNAAIGYTTAAPTTGLIVAGNVGVGTDSPGGRLDIAGANGSGAINAYIRGGSSSGDYGILNINNGSTIRGRLVADATVDAFRIDTAGGASTPITFLTGSSYTERARITSGGDFRVKGAGTAGSTDAFQISGSAPADAARLTSDGEFLVGATATVNSERLNVTKNGNVFLVKNTQNTGTARLVYQNGAGTIDYFYNYASSSEIGSITNTTTSVAYNTTSDYRLKDNQQPLTGSGAFIDALQPKTWNWTADGSKGVGFIAHEVQEVSPGSVTGTKDAVDEEGKPIMQAMEYGSAEFIANIIAELQSLRARVAQLEGK